MSVWPKIPANQVEAVFAEATGEESIQISYKGVSDAVKKVVDGLIKEKKITPAEGAVVQRTLFHSTAMSMGLFCFVYPYERYKKISKKDSAAVFGLDNFSDANGSALKAKYKETVIHTWAPSKVTPTWFADVMRNSFAHAQSQVVENKTAHKLFVDISNVDPKGNVNFHISMWIQDFGDLVALALQNFIGNVVQGGKWEPLSTILKQQL